MPTQFPLLPRLLPRLAVLLLAVGATAMGAPEESFLNCSFRTLGWENVPEKLYLATSTGYKEIEIDKHRFSAEYDYHGSPTLAFYRDIPSPAPGKSLPPPTITVNVTQGSGEYILLVLPKEDGEGFRILPIADSSTRLPNGSLTLVNVTRATLGIRVGEENRELEPLLAKTVPLPDTARPDRYRQKVPLQVYWKSPEGWEMLRSVFIFVPNNSNEFLFFHKPVQESGINGYVKDPIQWTSVSR